MTPATHTRGPTPALLCVRLHGCHDRLHGHPLQPLVPPAMLWCANTTRGRHAQHTRTHTYATNRALTTHARARSGNGRRRRQAVRQPRSRSAQCTGVSSTTRPSSRVRKRRILAARAINAFWLPLRDARKCYLAAACAHALWRTRCIQAHHHLRWLQRAAPRQLVDVSVVSDVLGRL